MHVRYWDCKLSPRAFEDAQKVLVDEIDNLSPVEVENIIARICRHGQSVVESSCTGHRFQLTKFTILGCDSMTSKFQTKEIILVS